MNTARFAGIVLGGAVCLYGLAAAAAEAPSYRGLRVPANAFEADASTYGIAINTSAVQRNAAIALPEFAPRILFSGEIQSRRFRSGAADYALALHRPVGYDIPSLAAPGMHTLHEVVPRYTLYSEFVQNLPGGVGLGIGVRHSEYNFSSASLLALSAERNWGSFRGAYTLYSNRLEGATLASAHRFEVNYLYGSRNTIGLSYTTGRDVDNTALHAGAAFGDVKDWTLSGRHWLTPNWALTYDVLTGDQGPLYRRQGLRLGVSRSF
ncbi:MAG TPA: YaiO family outer membrane beta-barrel protein [Burkholderiales bacterium]|nr:YaiO family outer membrane beta-barrel protein [Burkholderiales bacterium]